MELYDCLKKWSDIIPNQIAFLMGNDCLTYKQLNDLSDSLACYISELLPDDSSPVVVYGHMESLMLVSFLASVKSGHAYIPVDTSIPDERVLRIIQDSGAKLVLSPINLPFSDELRSVKQVQGVELNQILNAYKEKMVSCDSFVTDNGNFYIIYTSGSTGSPKGVQISYNNLMSFIKWMVDDFGLMHHQVFLNQAPFSFDLSVMDLYPSLFLGGSLWALSKEYIANPKQLFVSLEQSNANVWTSTPSFADLCLSDIHFSESMLPNLQRFLFCGEALSNQTAKKLRERFPKATIFNTYGPTECTVAATSIVIDDYVIATYDSLPIGISKLDGEIHLLSDSLENVADGEKGEIVIVGPHVSKGYLNQPDLTNKSFFLFEGKPAYRTGDVGFLKDGLVFYGGRLDFQVKVNGYRMELEEIETHFRALDLVRNAIVVPNYKDGKCEFLTAVLTVLDHDFEKEYQLTAYLKKELQRIIPQYMIPRKFVYARYLPMTNNGKIDRKRVMLEVTS